ncbi:hypothetical protein VNO77_02210 [Canavalia gladiata]|uniref:Uncharacterized protein n=1 Tax=Canavalia gladiata TaxID=3824 RepID=A0AAN9RB23_CANGL
MAFMALLASWLSCFKRLGAWGGGLVARMFGFMEDMARPWSLAQCLSTREPHVRGGRIGKEIWEKLLTEGLEPLTRGVFGRLNHQAKRLVGCRVFLIKFKQQPWGVVSSGKNQSRAKVKCFLKGSNLGTRSHERPATPPSQCIHLAQLQPHGYLGSSSAAASLSVTPCPPPSSHFGLEMLDLCSVGNTSSRSSGGLPNYPALPWNGHTNCHSKQPTMPSSSSLPLSRG